MKTLVINDKRITSILFSTELFVALFLLPYLKNDFFFAIPGLAVFCNILLCVNFLIFFPLCVLEVRRNVFFTVIIILEIWMYGVAPLISKADPPNYYYLLQCIGAISFFQIGFKRNYHLMLNVTTKMLSLFIALNAVMVAFHMDRFTDDTGVPIYLLGIRTLFSLYIIPAVLFNLLRDQEMKRITLRTVMTFGCGVYSLVNQAVSTGLIQIFIIVCLLLFSKSRQIAKRVNFVYVVIFLIAFDFALTIFGEKIQFLSIVADLFGKDLTFSGRTTIWAKTVERLGLSPIAGFGNDTDMLIVDTQRNSHNQWLYTAVQGGYVAMVLLILATLLSAIQLHKNRKEKWYDIVAICTIAVLVGTITEIQTYIPLFYIVLLLPYIIPKNSTSAS